MNLSINTINRFLAVAFSMAFLTSCSLANITYTQEKAALNNVVNDYFTTYAQRNNFKHFMSFYADNATFHDIIYGNHLVGKSSIREFFAWDKGDFSLVKHDDVLTITRQSINKRVVITEGIFHRFSYNNAELGPWLFIMIQEFNQENKIIRQSDWINYTPRKDFLGGENMNTKLIKR